MLRSRLKVKDITLAVAIILIFSLVPNGWAQQAYEYINKGVDFMEQGRYEEALVAFDISIDIEPTGDAYYDRGVALHSLGRSEEAIAAYNQALIFNQTDVGALYNKAVVLMNLTRYDEALAAFDKAKAIDPTGAFVQEARRYKLWGLVCYYASRISNKETE